MQSDLLNRIAGLALQKQRTNEMIIYCEEEYATTIRKSEVTASTRAYVDDGLSTVTATVQTVAALALNAISAACMQVGGLSLSVELSKREWQFERLEAGVRQLRGPPQCQHNRFSAVGLGPKLAKHESALDAYEPSSGVLREAVAGPGSSARRPSSTLREAMKMTTDRLMQARPPSSRRGSTVASVAGARMDPSSFRAAMAEAEGASTPAAGGGGGGARRSARPPTLLSSSAATSSTPTAAAAQYEAPTPLPAPSLLSKHAPLPTPPTPSAPATPSASNPFHTGPRALPPVAAAAASAASAAPAVPPRAAPASGPVSVPRGAANPFKALTPIPGPVTAPVPAPAPAPTPAPEPAPATATGTGRLYTDPAYAKFARLLKMGQPADQLRLRIQAEGLDPTVMDEAGLGGAPSPASAPAPAPAASDSSTGTGRLYTDPAYAKYVRLLKVGQPPEQLRLRIQAEGLDPTVMEEAGLCAAPAAAPARSPEPAPAPAPAPVPAPAMSKAAPAVSRGALTPLVSPASGKTPIPIPTRPPALGSPPAARTPAPAPAPVPAPASAPARALPSRSPTSAPAPAPSPLRMQTAVSPAPAPAPAPEPAPATPVGTGRLYTDPAYAKFARLLKMGQPADQLRLRIQAEGLDPTVMDEAGLGGDPALAPASAPAPPAAAASPPAVSGTGRLYTDPAYAKFARLLKMGQPADQLRLRIQAEGLDPTVMDEAGLGGAPAPASAPAPAPAPPARSPSSAPVPAPARLTSSRAPPLPPSPGSAAAAAAAVPSSPAGGGAPADMLAAIRNFGGLKKVTPPASPSPARGPAPASGRSPLAAASPTASPGRGGGGGGGMSMLEEMKARQAARAKK